MPVPLNKFTDAELLTLCALADEIFVQFDLGKVLTEAGAGFLRIMQEKQLWTPKDSGGQEI